MGLFTRAIRPPNEGVTPNPNDPADVPPATVGPPSAAPGDPNGVEIIGDDSSWLPPRIIPSAWSGWPADWWPPYWNGANTPALTDTAWMCIDKNASALQEMPPYLVGAADTLDTGWLVNPDPDLYTSWEEFIKQMAWDYQLGEAFVVATSYYSTGWPARFHVVPPWTVNVEIDEGRRVYTIGDIDVTTKILHVRYQSSVGDARGHGPLEVGGYRLTASKMLQQYANGIVSNGLIPSSILEAPEAMAADQAELLRNQWVAQRQANPGLPAVLSGGLKWTPTQLDPEQMALLELSQWNESRIAYLLGVPAYMVGLPTFSDSMTYSNVTALYDEHWRSGLRPKAQVLMAALSQWVLPRGTRVELNSDAYVQPGPLERAQTDQILASIIDPVTGEQAKTVKEIRGQERFDDSIPANLANGVLR